MKLVVVTGVGPGHATAVHEAVASVRRAMEYNTQFDHVTHDLVDDTQGILGCPGAKNAGIARNPDADWYFFLDADDLMEPLALRLNDFNAAATFGAVKLRGREHYKNVYPCTFRDIAIHGAGGTLTMGFFCNGPVARDLKFDDTDELTDDFKFYLRLPSFTKVAPAICTTCVDVPSSVGPRRIGADTADWTGACNVLIAQAVKDHPDKFNVSSEDVLSQVAPH